MCIKQSYAQNESSMIHEALCPCYYSISLQKTMDVRDLTMNFWLLRGSSHYAAQVERLLPKLLSRGEGRSPSKYIMSVLLSEFEYFIEKKFHLLTKVGIFILGGPKLLSQGRILGAKSDAKCCHVGTLEAFHFWSLTTTPKLLISIRYTN